MSQKDEGHTRLLDDEDAALPPSDAARRRTFPVPPAPTFHLGRPACMETRSLLRVALMLRAVLGQPGREGTGDGERRSSAIINVRPDHRDDRPGTRWGISEEPAISNRPPDRAVDVHQSKLREGLAAGFKGSEDRGRRLPVSQGTSARIQNRESNGPSSSSGCGLPYAPLFYQGSSFLLSSFLPLEWINGRPSFLHRWHPLKLERAGSS